MKNRLFIIAALFITSLFFGQNTVIGKWKTIDDVTGKAMSVVEIYEKDGKIYGRVSDILEVKNRNNKCDNCSGEDKGKPILGLVIIKGLQKDGDEYSGGKILDPKNGKVYKCTINLEGKDKLKVRGYLGISLLGRSQYWYRVK